MAALEEAEPVDVQGAGRVADDLMADREARFAAEAKYVALVEQIPGVVYLDPVDEAHDSIFVSPQIRDLLGIEPQEWLADQYCWSNHVHPDDFIRAWDDYMYSYSHDEPMSHEYRMVHEDGSVKWVLELARPIHDEHGDPWMIQGVIFDITERKEAEMSQVARSDRLASIIEIQRELATDELAVDAVMRQICERTQELTHADSATVLTLDGDHLEIRAATGFLEDEIGTPISIDDSLPGWWYRHDESTILGDAQADPRAGILARELGMRSLAVVQLRHRDEKAGQLIAISRKPDAFTQGDLETLELLSVVLSSALSHAAEFESKRQQLDALSRFQTMYQEAAIGITLGVARRQEHRRQPGVRGDVRLLRGGTDDDDPARLHACGRHRQERNAVRGDDGRAAATPIASRNGSSARTASSCGGKSCPRCTAAPTANRSTPSRWSRTSPSASWPRSRSSISHITTSSRDWRTARSSKRCSRWPSLVRGATTKRWASSSSISTTSSS